MCYQKEKTTYESFTADSPIGVKMYFSAFIVGFLMLCPTVSFSQSQLCNSFESLLNIDFGINGYKAKKYLLSTNEPFIQDVDQFISGVNRDFYIPLAKFNVPDSLYNKSAYRHLRADSVFKSEAHFKLPRGCAKFENEISLVFADDTLYYFDIEIDIPPENLNEGLELLNELKELLKKKYPFSEEYDLKAFDSEEVGGEGIEFTNSKEAQKQRKPDREVAWLHFRNLFQYASDSDGDYISTGIVKEYKISLTVVNYKFTRLNGLGSYL